MAEKRHLPVLNDKARAPAPEADESEARPGWHWVGFGTVAIFGAWLPLAYASQWFVSSWIARHMGRAGSPEEVAAWLATLPKGTRTELVVTTLVPHALSVSLASFAGGFLVGRYGPSDIGVRGGAAAGFGAGLVAVVLSIGASGFSPALLAVLLLTTLFAAVGTRFARRNARPVVKA